MGNTQTQKQTADIATPLTKSNANTLISIPITINSIEEIVRQKKIILNAAYSQDETPGSIHQVITDYLNQNYEDYRFYVWQLNINTSPSKIWQIVPITHWDKKVLINDGITVKAEVTKYVHKTTSSTLTCEYMKEKDSTDPLQCPIYSAMRQKYQWNQDNLNHLTKFSHFTDEFASKPECKYNQNCHAYIRLEEGGNRVNDQCHMKIYKHPPRSRNIKLAENINSLIINKNKKQNHDLYRPTDQDREMYDLEQLSKERYLSALIDEVIANGFTSDLCLKCGPNDECKHEDHSILQIVNEKMKCFRHQCLGYPLNKAQMLSLILYTGCDCNYDLCKSQREGDYLKWKWFDCCLYQAIRAISMKEKGSFSVFSGLNKVKLDEKSVNSGYFVTYVSTSWRKAVAESFMSGDGIIIQINESFKSDRDVYCCDVSWISKFPDECEILFARSTDDELYGGKGFKCTVVDESNGVQTVSLDKKEQTDTF